MGLGEFGNRRKMRLFLPFDARFLEVVSKGAQIPYNCRVCSFFQQIDRFSGILRNS